MYGQNNGYYPSYSPYYPQNTGAMPDALSSYKQPYQMPQMALKTTNDLLFVLNENEATSYPVAPNTVVTLWDKNNPVIYLKSADAQGIPSMRILDFTERTPNASADADYVKKADFEKMQARLDELAEKIKAKEDNV